jgi:hypothetical protein
MEAGMIRCFGLSLAFLTICVTASYADCTCRAQGRDFEMGQSVCMATPKGFRLATCGMVLNNSSWNVSESPCVVSARGDLLKRKERAQLAASSHQH